MNFYRLQAHYWLGTLIAAVLCLFLTSCGTEPANSELLVIWGEDDRVPVATESEYQQVIGALDFRGKVRCTAFAVGPRQIMTAEHCVDRFRLGYHSFRSALGSFPVASIEDSKAYLDLVVLNLKQQLEPIYIDSDKVTEEETQAALKEYRKKLNAPIFTSALQIAKSDMNNTLESVELISYSVEKGILLQSKSPEKFKEAGAGFYLHQLDTVSGASGSPILQNGHVIAIHIGMVKDLGNLATSSHTLFEVLPKEPFARSKYNLDGLIYRRECVKTEVENGSPIFDQNGNVIYNPQVTYDYTDCVRLAASISLDLIPGVSNTKSIVEALLGMDIITFEALTPAEQAMSVAGIVAGPALKGVAASAQLSMVVRKIAREIGYAKKAVLGHFPAYIEKANEIGGSTFQIPERIWNQMPSEKQWEANHKFLDRLISRNAEVVLATKPESARPGSFFARELRYLQEKGYRVAPDGSRMFPPQ